MILRKIPCRSKVPVGLRMKSPLGCNWKGWNCLFFKRGNVLAMPSWGILVVRCENA